MKTIASSLTGPYNLAVYIPARDIEERMEALSVSIVDGVYVITAPRLSVFTYPVNAVEMRIFKDN